MLDRSRSRDRSKTGDPFSPAGLFVTGAQGAWYDPSDFSTLYQTSTGTTPVTAVEQPVGLMLDRSRGLVLGSELVTNGGFATDSDWTKGTGWTIAGGVATHAAGTASALDQANVTTPGAWYEFTVNAVASGGTWALQLAGGSTTTIGSSLTTGNYTFIAQAAASNTTLRLFAGTGTTLEIDNISVRELPGNHATQATSASRPVLRARYNLLTRSEEFDNVFWGKTGTTITANAAVAPDGTTTADKIVEVTAASTPRVGRSFTTIISAVYTLSVYAKAAERDQIRIVLQGSGLLGPYFLLTGAGSVSGAGSTTSSITNVGNGWYRCVITYTATSTNADPYIATASGGAVIASGDNTKGVLLWGAQLLTAADQTSTGGAYQRIAAATDYDTSNPVFRPYLAFDGTDDSFGTSSIDFSATDEMTVFAGLTKLSDTSGMIAELTTGGASGSTYLLGSTGYQFRSGGTTLQNVDAASLPAPNTSVLTGIGDISGDVARIRRNGAVIDTNTGDQGTGNYANAAFFIGRRNNTSLPFNGRLYSLAVLGRTATDAELASMEAWVNGKTGAF